MRQRFILAPARPDLAGPVLPDVAAQVQRRNFLGRVLGLIGAGALLSRPARAGTAPNEVLGASPFLGEIAMVGFNFAPRGWALCNGQLLPILDNDALFSLLGTTYGGDGQETFALPNLNGRAPNHRGQGPGLSNYVIGQAAGSEAVTLNPGQIPTHTHGARAVAGLGDSVSPGGRYPAKNAAGTPSYGNNPGVLLGASAIDPAGGSQPHDNMQPYLAIHFIIALEGIYPSVS